MKRLAGLAIASLALLLFGCPEDDNVQCSGSETVIVKMTGTCASGARTFEIFRSGCGVFLHTTAPDAGAVPTDLGLPTQGNVGQKREPIRQGGWNLWGCAKGNTMSCPIEDFRLCSADRVAFQLNVTCVDGTGAPVCEAVLTE